MRAYLGHIGGVRQRLTTLAVLLAVAFGLLSLSAVPAEASHWTGPEVCGAGSYVTKLNSPISNASGHRIGSLVLTKHRNSDTFCAATLRRYHDNRRFMNVKIKRRGDGGWWQTDPTRGFEFAGPVYREKNNGTIIARGVIGTQWTEIHWKGPNHWCKVWAGSALCHEG